MDHIKQEILKWLDDIAKGCKYRPPVEVRPNREELPGDVTKFTIEIFATKKPEHIPKEVKRPVANKSSTKPDSQPEVKKSEPDKLKQKP